MNSKLGRHLIIAIEWSYQQWFNIFKTVRPFSVVRSCRNQSYPPSPIRILLSHCTKVNRISLCHALPCLRCSIGMGNRTIFDHWCHHEYGANGIESVNFCLVKQIWLTRYVWPEDKIKSIPYYVRLSSESGDLFMFNIQVSTRYDQYHNSVQCSSYWNVQELQIFIPIFVGMCSSRSSQATWCHTPRKRVTFRTAANE